MTNPRDDDATLAKVYAALADRVYEDEDDNRCQMARDHLALVQAYSSPPADLLDVGCATGLFVSEAHQAGWRASGLDASTWAIARARERCPQATLVPQMLEDANFSAEEFEVITLWDVLEHIRSPVETLRRVWKWMQPGGWLFLNLPNANSLVAKLMGRYWVLLLREHLWYFSPETMALLLPQAGFQVVSTRSNRVRFSMANVLGRLAQYPDPLGIVARRMSTASALKKWTVRFAIGEMTVVARKSV
jgi:predicted TPR repeat methyltransferase